MSCNAVSTLAHRAHRSYATLIKTPLILPVHPPNAPSSPKPTPPPPPPGPSSSSTPPPKTSTTAQSTLPKPRLDYHSLLADPGKTTANHLSRKSVVPYGSDTVAHLKRLRETQLLLLQKLETIRAKQREMGQVIKSGLMDRDEALRQAKKLKTRAGDYEANLSATETELLEIGLALPNFSSSSTPLGPESNAVEIERIGPWAAAAPAAAAPIEADPRRDHLDLATYWDLVDNDASATTTGASWPYLVSTLAILEHALVNYALSVAIRHGFTPVSTPDVVKKDIAVRCGFQPRDEAAAVSQTYHIAGAPGENGQQQQQPELCLAGTAEIPLAGLFANKVLDGASLPRRVVGVGKAFRAEAGARGSDTRGLYRVHQFTKVELFTVCAADRERDGAEGWAEMDKIRAVQTEIARGLGLSVRVLEMPTEELGASAARKWDMEAWMPGRGKWGEITSTSNCTDYQARRLHVRYRPTTSGHDGLPFAHTLNGTAAAIPRLLVALLENGARFGDDGKPVGLDLPRALHRFWVGGDHVGEGKNRGQLRWV